MSFAAPKFTNAGKLLQARALSGECEIKFTSIAIGSGELTTQTIATLTDLIALVKRCDITDIKRTNIDTVQLKAIFENTTISSGFYWREVGLYAADPEEPNNRSADILFCYQNAGDLAEYIPSASQQLLDKKLNMLIAISDAAQISAVIKSELYADSEEFNAHLTDIKAHSNLFGDVVLYVNGSNGSDDNDGLTSANAKQTINGAIRAIPPACRLANIIISDGTYNEDIDISYSRCGTLTLEGVEGEAVTVKSILARSLDYLLVKNISVTGSTEKSASVVIYASNFRLENVTITNGASIETGIVAQYGSGLLTNCTISGFDKGLHVAYGASAEVRSSTFEKNTVDLSAYGAQIYIDNDNFTRDSVAGGSVICGSVGKALTLGRLVRSINGVSADASGNVSILNLVYPIGSIYMSVANVSPATFIGGTWEALNEGRVLIGANSTYKAGSTGGEFTHTLSVKEMPSHDHTWSGTTSSNGSHGHTASSNSTGAHTHSLGGRVHAFNGSDADNASHLGYKNVHNFYGMGNDTTASAGAHSHTITVNSNGAHTHTYSGTTSSNGSSNAHNNMQPYLSVYMWKRVS